MYITITMYQLSEKKYQIDLIGNIHPDIKKKAIKTNINKWELGLSIKEKKIIGYVCRDLLGKMSYDKIDSEMNLFELLLYLYYKMRIFFKIDSY